MKALHDGEVEQAEARLTALWAVEKSARVACDLGLSLSLLEKWPSAAAMMERCVDLAGSRAGERIRATHRTVMEKVQRVDVVVNPDDAEVTVSGAERGERSLYLAPGPYELVVSYPRYITATRKLTAVAGSQTTYDITLERDPSAPAASEPGELEPERPPEPLQEEPDYSVRNWVVIGAGVVAVGSFVVATLFNASASSASDRWDELGGDRCRTGDRQPNCLEASGVWSDWRSDSSTRNVFLGVGVGAAALGVVAYLLWPEPTPRTGGLTHEFSVGSEGGQWIVSGGF
ncbi:MAG: PEGA domain-containing protein [Polyangiaceae bacterium]|nr:PEGA domain-containing protein [Polyangiaceae bacterium]